MVALKDPRRVFNQDETAVELGVGAQWVLVEKNTKQVYTVSSNTREHITVSYTVNASGGMLPPHAVFSGKRNIAKVKLASMPKDGMSGEWGFSYSENGWVTQEVYLDIVKDLGIYIQKQGIPTPVLLFLDGALCHLSLAISQLCNDLKIQPILLRPNTTHLIQPLDVTFFSSLKAGLKVEQELWHRKVENVGSSLSKYGVIPLVHGVTEKILEPSHSSL